VDLAEYNSECDSDCERAAFDEAVRTRANYDEAPQEDADVPPSFDRDTFLRTYRRRVQYLPPLDPRRSERIKAQAYKRQRLQAGGAVSDDEDGSEDALPQLPLRHCVD
jgi:hypothetical protein